MVRKVAGENTRINYGWHHSLDSQAQRDMQIYYPFLLVHIQHYNRQYLWFLRKVDVGGAVQLKLWYHTAVQEVITNLLVESQPCGEALDVRVGQAKVPNLPQTKSSRNQLEQLLPSGLALGLTKTVSITGQKSSQSTSLNTSVLLLKSPRRHLMWKLGRWVALASLRDPDHEGP